MDVRPHKSTYSILEGKAGTTQFKIPKCDNPPCVPPPELIPAPELKTCKTCHTQPCHCSDEDDNDKLPAQQQCPCGAVDKCSCVILQDSISSIQSIFGSGSGAAGGDTAEVLNCGCLPPCDCDSPSPSRTNFDKRHKFIRNDIIEPKSIDHTKPFYEKLNQNLHDLRKRTCFETFGKNRRYGLSKDLIRQLLIEDEGKVACYLPGNELYPALLLHRINDKDMCLVRSVLMDNRAVTSINLAYNDIGDHGLKQLAPAIKDCGNISHVNLMHNNFSGKGLMYLVEALQKRAPLLTLRLTGVKFGDGGINALVCLILSGRVPIDLDIGECDLTVQGFQTLCTAFHALDHDINYPNFLMDHELPIDLVTLKDMKEQYNADLGHLSRMGDKIVTTRFTLNKNENKLSAWEMYNAARLEHQEKCRAEMLASNVQLVPEIFQEFSTSILQGLFDIRHRFSGTELPISLPAPPPTEGTSKDKFTTLLETSEQIVQKSRQITEELRALGSLDDYINEYNTKKNKSWLDDKDIYALPIMNRSMYTLDVDEDEQLLSEFSHDIDNPDKYVCDDDDNDNANNDHDHTKTKMKLYHGQVIDFNQSLLKRSVQDAEVVDEMTANEAAREAAQDMIKAAAQTIGNADEMTEKTDIIQLLLMTLVDMYRKSQEMSSKDNYDVREVTKLLEIAMDKLEEFFRPRIPEACSTIQEGDIKLFISNLVHSASGTFLKLLHNEQVCKVLAQEGSIACRTRLIREKSENQGESSVHVGESETGPLNSEINLSDEQIRYVALQFLNGAIDEAARLIGTGDPFGFRDKKNKERGGKTCTKESKALRLAHAQQIFDTESNVYSTVEKLIEMSGQLAGAVKEDAQDVQKMDTLYKEAANSFIDTLFSDVRDTLGEFVQSFEEPEPSEETDVEALMKLKYSYVSRPTRLVLNRPFFRHYEELMGTKLGDYLKGNRTLKALHIQKWNLGEDGMLGLMDGLMSNKTVRSLDLGCNELGADGMRLLGIYLGINKNLKHVVLNHNHLKDPGVLNLIEHITESNIVSLNIAHNDITRVGLDPLLSIIPKTKIYALYLWGNSFGVESWKLFKNLRDKNIIKESDTLLQQVDEDSYCIVKDSQTRSMNQYYEVKPILEAGLHVPVYLNERVFSRTYFDDDDDDEAN